MPICSYLVFPQPDADGLGQQLAEVPGCEVTPADNEDLMILVTDTEDAEQEAALQERLRRIEGIGCLVLTFGDVDGTEPPPRRSRGGGDPQ